MPGQQAKMMSEQLSKLVSKVDQTKTVIIFINQVRSTMSGLFLNKETTPGRSALKFYSNDVDEYSHRTISFGFSWSRFNLPLYEIK
ncbi:DNA recombination/repair protein RecA [Lactococcus lactis]|uniref:Protein RecA n=1 Tax=Lactococcus lactis TaxID=1358 RepID=A0AAE4NNU1_9LACT|nr:DNA recombination/repair protein RecA [Lactococcus lactis]MDM7536342.1 DNA recombination/repair protein RecA [Lactococcus lactis]MDQ7173184.1 DNA recombination/repair protein RecA [Lactococcus lactis]MDV2631705.1 DNA recombination/repair protein RecA [Lactococcus lactis]WMM21041.1 DNA recombination/repair protein RecA [Lactococcus lactis]